MKVKLIQLYFLSALLLGLPAVGQVESILNNGFEAGNFANWVTVCAARRNPRDNISRLPVFADGHRCRRPDGQSGTAPVALRNLEVPAIGLGCTSIFQIRNYTRPFVMARQEGTK